MNTRTLEQYIGTIGALLMAIGMYMMTKNKVVIPATIFLIIIANVHYWRNRPDDDNPYNKMSDKEFLKILDESGEYWED